MIVNHTTGEQTTLRAIRQRFTGIAQTADPEQGIRTPWADESAPTDAELRLIGYSYRADTPRPVNTVAAPDALIDNVWTQQWAPIPDADVRARIISEIKDAARQHILAAFPEWKQANLTARAVELAEIRESREMTAEESAQHQALHAAWDWVRSVRSASDAAESEVAAMDRAQLGAWVMPELPAWNL